MKAKTLLILFLIVTINGFAQSADIVNIPDSNFEQALIDLGWDTNGKNGNISTVDAQKIDTISIIFKDADFVEVTYPSSEIEAQAKQYFSASKTANIKISNLEGIGSMPNLKYLEVQHSDLSSINISLNTQLETLVLYNHNIEILNTINQTKLKHAFVGGSSVFTGLYTLNSPDLEFIDIRETSIESFFSSSVNSKLKTLLLSNNRLKNVGFEKYLELETLWLGDNNLDSSLGIDVNTKLERLFVENNQFSFVGVVANIALRDLDISGNPISGLNIDRNLNLEKLNISGTPTTAFNVPETSKLNTLIINNTLLNELTFVETNNLKNLEISNNQLTKIDINNLINLERLIADNNLITEIRLEKNINLKKISLQNNSSLVKVNLSNGTNTIITDINLLNNPALTCVQVDDDFYSQTNWPNIENNSIYNQDCGFVSQDDIVNIPDENFEQALIDLGWDKDGKNGYILKTDAALVDEITIKYQTEDDDNQVTFPSIRGSFFNPTKQTNIQIADLTGIEGMPNLTYLEIKNGNLTTVDLTQNVKLEKLSISATNLGRIDIKNLTELTALEIGLTTKMDWLDIAANTKIEFLNIYNTSLPELDIRANQALQYLYLPTNSIVNMDHPDSLESLIELSVKATRIGNLKLEVFPNLKVFDASNGGRTPGVFSNNLALEELYLDTNGFEGIDVTKNSELRILSIRNNQLENLDVFKNTKLEAIYLSNNRLQEFDLSKNVALKIIEAKNINSLRKVNLANGNNTQFTFVDLSNNQEPNLSCVEVDNVNYAQETFTNVHNTNVFSLDCDFEEPQDVIRLSDTNFEKALVDLGLDTNGITGNILTADALKITALDISDPVNNANLPNVEQAIVNVSGIEDMVNLKTLNIAYNAISSLNITPNINLETIIANKNRLNSLNIAGNTSLIEVNLNDNNNLSSLTLEGNTNLKSLSVNSTLLTAINTVAIPNIETLKIESTIISNIDVSNNQELKTLNASKSDISNLDVSNNLKLEHLNVRTTNLETVNVAENTNLDYLVISNIRNLSTINLANNSSLKTMYADSLAITALDLSKNINLENLSLAYNNIQNLDISSNLKLKQFRYANSTVKEIDLSKHTALTSLDILFSSNLEQVIFSNGANEKIEFINIFINDKLNCIQVDDVDYATANWRTGVRNTSLFNLDCSSIVAPELVTVPDSNFEQYLVNNGFDNNGLNGNITKEDAEKIISLRPQEAGIASLQGIEGMPNLESLDAASNNIISIDLSNNLKLKTLNLGGNRLTDIDINNNVALEVLVLSSNSISEINLDKNIKIKDLQFNATGLSTLDISSLVDLEKLFLSSNSISEIDVSNNTKLNHLLISRNKLLKLDVTKNINLERLDVTSNSLTGIDISNNISLFELGLSNNNIINIDINQNKKLQTLLLNNNAIERAYLKNGSNNLITNFNISNNPNLTCITVDDVESASGIFENRDSTASFSLDCSAEWTIYTTDQNLQTALDAIAGLDDDGDGRITYEEAQAFTGAIDLSGLNITNISGLEAFINAASINISGNSITDISALLTANTIIVASRVSGEKRTFARGNSNVKILNVANNLIEEIDITQVSSITELNVSNNKLKILDINNGSNEILEKLNATGNPDLTCIQVDNTADALAKTNWVKDEKASYSTNCRPSLNITQFTKNDILVYPNPSSSIVTISLANNFTLKSVEILNATGKLILKAKTSNLNISNLPVGIYFVKVVSDKGTQNIKLVKN